MYVESQSRDMLSCEYGQNVSGIISVFRSRSRS